MNHQGTKTIETKRLILKKYTQDDAECVLKNWANDPKVTEFLRWKPHGDISVTRDVIASWIKGYEKDSFYQWNIVLRDSGESIGSISVVDQNEKLGILHIGYCIGAKWWNQGITSEAFSAVIAFLFDEVGANRVESQHDPNNPHSGAVMRKCGLKYEGTLRQADFSNKGIVDASVYAILKSEWEKRKRSAEI